MQPLITGAQARQADEAAVARGDSWDGLMARAGHGLAASVVDELRGRTGGVYGRRVLVVVGKGDNGGDGWVAARHLRERGIRVTVLAVHGVDVATSDHSGRAREVCLASGGRVLDGLGDGDAVDAELAAIDLRVDCVLGTGVRGAPRDEAATAVAVCNDGGGPVVAADVPSGLDADTGAAPGGVDDLRGVVRAVRTVTFGARKRGLALHPGADIAGRVDVVDLGPRWRPEGRGEWSLVTDGDVRPTPLGAGTDKHGRGRVLVVAGSRRYAGAGALSAAATVRAGAGLVTLATSGPCDPVRALEPGVMAVRLPDDGTAVGGPSADALDAVVELAADADVAVLGPGCGYGHGTRVLADALLGSDLDLVLDADGLNVFRGDADALGDHTGRLVLTPHHRELARLVDPGTGGDEALARRHELVPDLADRLDAIVVGKGPATVVAARDGVCVTTSGGPALGSGGTGDVLAGLVGAWLAGPDGRDPGRGGQAASVAAAVQLHGMLGDRAGARSGGRATAADLLDVLPGLLAELVAAGSGS